MRLLRCCNVNPSSLSTSCELAITTLGDRFYSLLVIPGLRQAQLLGELLQINIAEPFLHITARAAGY
jgi:hypothetical protein